MLAKLTCGLHKPNRQTVLPQASLSLLYKSIPIKKIRNLGGKLGDQVIQKFEVEMMSDLLTTPKTQFINTFGDKTGSWLYNISRGVDTEPVNPRQLPKSIGCGKNFPGKSSLDTKEKVMHWVKQLSTELEERLIKDLENNRRFAKLLTCTVRNSNASGFSLVSRSCPIHIYNAEKIAHDAFATLQKFNTSSTLSCTWQPPILSLAMSAGKFEDKVENGSSDIQTYFQTTKSPNTASSSTSTSHSSPIDTLLDIIDDDKRECSDTSELSVHTPSTKSDLMQDLGRNNSVRLKSSECSNKLKSSFAEKKSKVHTNEIAHFFNFPSTSTAAEPSKLQSEQKGFFARKLEERMRKKASAADLTTEERTQMNESVSDSPLPMIEPISEQIQNVDNLAALDPEMLGRTSKLEERMQADLTAPERTQVNGSISHSPLCGTEPISEQAQSLENLDPELVNTCPKCNKKIPVWEQEEHSDYHIALALSKERILLPKPAIDPSKIHVSNAKKSTTSKKSDRKRSMAPVAIPNPKKKQQNTLDSFLKTLDPVV